MLGARVLAGYALFFTLFFAPALATGRTIGDAVDQLIEALPLYGFDHPLWETRTMLGFPMFANATHPYWYPLALLRFVPGSYDVYEVCAYVIAAFGTYGLARALTGSTFGAVLAGFVYALGGFMIGHAGHVDIVHPAAWVPFVFWALVSLRGRPRPLAAAGLAAALALVALAGQPQIFVYALALASVFTLAFARGAPAGAARWLLAAGGSLALGCALAAVTLVPQWELASQSVRAHLTYDTFVGFAVPAGELPLRLFFPMLLGSTPMAPYAYSNFDFGSFSEMTVFVGGTTLVLAAIACASSLRDGYVRFWLAVAVVALFLGTDVGLTRLTYLVPVYNLFRAPNRHAFEAALAFAMLAAYGIAAIETGRARFAVVARASAAVVGAALILMTLLASFPNLLVVQITAVLGAVTVSLDPAKNAALWLPALLLIAGAAAILWWARRPADAARRLVLGAALVADLAAFGWFSYWNYGAFPAARLAPPPYAARLRAVLAATHQRVLTVPTLAMGTGIPPNLNLLWDIPSARGYVPLEPARSAAFLPVQSVSALLPLLAPEDRRLDVAAVRYVIVPGTEAAPALAALQADPQRFHPLAATGDDRVYENRRAFPVAWIVHRVVPAGDDPAARFADRSFDPSRAALIANPPAGIGGGTSAGDRLAIGHRADGEMSLDVTCAGNCVVVTSDLPYPGWSVTVDGTPQPLLQADVALRAVAAGAGAHRIRFAYRPWSLVAGGAISALAAIVALALVLRSTSGGRRGLEGAWTSRRSLPLRSSSSS